MKNSSLRFGLNGLSIMLLRLISKHSPSVLEARLKGSLQVPFTPDQFDEAIAALKNRKYIEQLSESDVQVGEAGKQFLETYDLYEHEELLEGNLVYVILKFLTELDDSITTKGFPKIIVDHVPRQYYGGDVENLNHFLEFDPEMAQYVTLTKNQRFSINVAGKSRYQIEAKKRVKTTSLEDYITLVLSELDKKPAFISETLEQYGQTDPTLIRGIEAEMKTRGIIGLTNTGAYITPSGRAYLVRSKLGGADPITPSIQITNITSHGSHSTIATGSKFTIGHVENKTAADVAGDPNQKKALSISRKTLFWTVLAVIVAIVFGILTLRHRG